MARFTAAPKAGHMQRMLRVFGYLKGYLKYGILVDPTERVIAEVQELMRDWDEYYPGAKEELPKDMPIPKGKKVTLSTYVDADHAHEQLTRRSVTGILIFLNNTPVKWYSKRQNTVESSTYGAELVALRIATEFVIEYRYKLRMLGVPMEGPSPILCDNQSAVTSTSLPSSTLKKRHNAIAYHRVREAVAARVIGIHHIPGKNNVADILTKAADGPTFRQHVKSILKPL